MIFLESFSSKSTFFVRFLTFFLYFFAFSLGLWQNEPVSGQPKARNAACAQWLFYFCGSPPGTARQPETGECVG
jgi:hypothetical protein